MTPYTVQHTSYNHLHHHQEDDLHTAQVSFFGTKFVLALLLWPSLLFSSPKDNMVLSPDAENPEPDDDPTSPDYEAIVQDQTDYVRAALLPRPPIFTSPSEPHTTHPITLFLTVVFPAFFGLAYYFILRPHPLSAKTRASLPHTAVAPTILISIDAFREEYLTRSRNGEPLAPTLQSIVNNGVRASNGMQAVMPTKTFPNHWSLATGLYAESHGIVGNTMYDPSTQRWFHVSGKEPQWWHGEPIWQTLRRTRLVTLDRNNTPVTTESNYTTGCVFWPGSDVEKHRPDAFWEYNQFISYEKRITRAIALLFGTAHDLDRPAQFITLYFEGVDHAGHEHGPNSPQVDREIERVDKAIGHFLSMLGENFESRFNVIVVSDHGMTEVSEERVVDLSPAMAPGTVQDVRITPLGLWLNQTVPAETVYKEIQDELAKHDDNAKVYDKEDIPERWHLRNSPLVTHTVTMAKLGWTVVYPHQELVPGAEHRLPRDLAVKMKGNHGFDNTEEDMRAIFLAQGPAFQSGATVDGFQAVDVYPLLCHIFGASPAPHNGTLQKSLNSILREKR